MNGGRGAGYLRAVDVQLHHAGAERRDDVDRSPGYRRRDCGGDGLVLAGRGRVEVKLPVRVAAGAGVAEVQRDAGRGVVLVADVVAANHGAAARRGVPPGFRVVRGEPAGHGQLGAGEAEPGQQDVTGLLVQLLEPELDGRAGNRRVRGAGRVRAARVRGNLGRDARVGVRQAAACVTARLGDVVVAGGVVQLARRAGVVHDVPGLRGRAQQACGEQAERVVGAALAAGSPAAAGEVGTAGAAAELSGVQAARAAEPAEPGIADIAALAAAGHHAPRDRPCRRCRRWSCRPCRRPWPPRWCRYWPCRGCRDTDDPGVVRAGLDRVVSFPDVLAAAPAASAGRGRASPAAPAAAEALHLDRVVGPVVQVGRGPGPVVAGARGERRGRRRQLPADAQGAGLEDGDRRLGRRDRGQQPVSSGLRFGQCRRLDQGRLRRGSGHQLAFPGIS